MAVFEISEMLNVAVKDEEVGEAFYKAIAERTSNARIKERLINIAAQEKYHAARFRDMAKSVKEAKTHEQYKGEYEEYMKTLLTNRDFPDANTAVSKAKSASDKDCIHIAEGMEKDAILFYEELMKFVPKNYSNYLNDIITEERNHLAELAFLKNL